MSPAIENGKLDRLRMVQLGTGVDNIGRWYHLAPAGTAARWRELRRLAFEKYGVWLLITPGWNVYRPLEIQVIYKQRLGIYAAEPGFSSHGGVFRGRECMAIDVQNWQDLGSTDAQAWSRFVALCRIVGFTVDFVTPQERWHVGDFNPWVVPQFAAIVVKPLPKPVSTRGDIVMRTIENTENKDPESRNATVSEDTFRVQGEYAATRERRLWGAPLKVNQEEWNGILAETNQRRRQKGLAPLKGVRGE